MKSTTKLIVMALALPLFLANSGCNQGQSNAGAPTSVASTSLDRLTIGNWGSDIANFMVSQEGAVLDLGCGLGQISEPVFVDQNGEFVVVGTFQMGG